MEIQSWEKSSDKLGEGGVEETATRLLGVPISSHLPGQGLYHRLARTRRRNSKLSKSSMDTSNVILTFKSDLSVDGKGYLMTRRKGRIVVEGVACKKHLTFKCRACHTSRLSRCCSIPEFPRAWRRFLGPKHLCAKTTCNPPLRTICPCQSFENFSHLKYVTFPYIGQPLWQTFS
jgi:hypothetical protein